MERSFLHLIAGIIWDTESTVKMHISRKSIWHFQHKLKQLPQVHIWKHNWVQHSKSKYFKITKKLLYCQHQVARVVYRCGIYWQPWTCKGSQKVGTTLGSYCSILMKFFQQSICCPMALTVRTFLFSQWHLSTLRDYVRGRIKGNCTTLKNIAKSGWLFQEQSPAPWAGTLPKSCLCQGGARDRWPGWTGSHKAARESVTNYYNSPNVSAALEWRKADWGMLRKG